MIVKKLDIDSLLAEGVDLEWKLAAGRNGKGELPASTWETYSAMANTHGGRILLGGRESGNSIKIEGVENPSKVVKQLWDGLNNRQKVSVNLLQNADIRIESSENKRVVVIRVPRARRQQRPVYIGSNPLGGTYRRAHEGDYKCTPEEVRRMLAESIEDVRDVRVLPGFSQRDLSNATIQRYRATVANAKPDLVFLKQDDTRLLRSLGALSIDRETGAEGLTIAGLLMFGQLRAILDAAPNYVVDYQERPRPRTELRWVDRLTTDFSWSGNLFDFFSLTITRLYRDLKVPFKLKGAQRVDSSPVHEALREALTNTIIHADYSGRMSILVVRRPDLFGFRNPGTMRVPVEEAIKGGHSDCRNRTLQKMFQLAGFGEQAGAGVPSIFHNWTEQWRKPVLTENVQREETILTLYSSSLLAPEVLGSLDDRIGPVFRTMNHIERLALAAVEVEGQVTHQRIKEISADHPHDITLALSSLVRDGHLDSKGATRNKYYFFPGEPPEPAIGPSLESPESLPHLPDSLPHSEKDLPHWGQLQEKASRVRRRGKAPKDMMEKIILDVCQAQFLTARAIADLVGRKEKTIRSNYLPDLVGRGLLELRYPAVPRHPEQAYRTRST